MVSSASVPQTGEHGAPLAVSVHLTPAAAVSLSIVTPNWAERYFPEPAASSVTLFRMAIEIALTITTVDDNFDGSLTEVAVIVTVRSAGTEAGAAYVARPVAWFVTAPQAAPVH